ncbi:hypothetical protein L6452_01613 [Arctium lappa]|uniref:Uncharacterized protein n=1 Tax=Arctium lappa TaxID=4217 RepID=A0ACB9FH86_ARCLA|nr:hypothetical protein L6452_01613 [Arctium lappa]
MDKSVRDAHEAQAVMKSFVASTSDSAKPDKFLGYMVPSVGELSKDISDETEDISYTWVREYRWDVRGSLHATANKADSKKKRSREGKTSDEVEHFPVPASITVRQRSNVSVEMKESEGGSKGRSLNGRRHDGNMEMEDMDLQSKGAEYDMSD